jgi:hypothetical protein
LKASATLDIEGAFEIDSLRTVNAQNTITASPRPAKKLKRFNSLEWVLVVEENEFNN